MRASSAGGSVLDSGPPTIRACGSGDCSPIRRRSTGPISAPGWPSAPARAGPAVGRRELRHGRGRPRRVPRRVRAARLRRRPRGVPPPAHPGRRRARGYGHRRRRDLQPPGAAARAPGAARGRRARRRPVADPGHPLGPRAVGGAALPRRGAARARRERRRGRAAAGRDGARRGRAGGRPSFAAALAVARRRYGIASVLCEGGPRVLRALCAEGVVDELFLTLSPRLTGGGDEPGVTEGELLPDPAALELVWALERDGFLFLRYARRIGSARSRDRPPPHPRSWVSPGRSRTCARARCAGRAALATTRCTEPQPR